MSSNDTNYTKCNIRISTTFIIDILLLNESWVQGHRGMGLWNRSTIYINSLVRPSVTLIGWVVPQAPKVLKLGGVW